MSSALSATAPAPAPAAPCTGNGIDWHLIVGRRYPSSEILSLLKSNPLNSFEFSDVELRAKRILSKTTEMKGSEEYNLKRNLFMMIAASRLTRDENEYKDILNIGVKNSIRLLRSARVSLSKMDFSDCNLRGVDLSNCVLDSVNFGNAIMSNVNLSQSWIRNCNFMGSHDLHTVNWGQMPPISLGDQYEHFHRVTANLNLLIAVNKNSVGVIEVKSESDDYDYTFQPTFQTNVEILASAICAHESNLIYLSHKNEIVQRDYRSGEIVKTIPITTPITTFGYCASKQLLVGSSSEGKMWEIKDPLCSITFSQTWEYGDITHFSDCVSFNHSGSLVATRHFQADVIVWNTNNTNVWTFETRISSDFSAPFTFHPYRDLLFFGRNNIIQVYDCTSKSTLEFEFHHSTKITSISFDSQYLQHSDMEVEGQTMEKERFVTMMSNGIATVWEENRSKKPVRQYAGSSNRFSGETAFISSDQVVTTVGNKIYLWRLPLLNQEFTVRTSAADPYFATFCNLTNDLLVSTQANQLEFHSIHHGLLIERYRAIKTRQHCISMVAVDPNDQRIAIPAEYLSFPSIGSSQFKGYGYIELIENTPTEMKGREPNLLKGHEAVVTCLDFNHDGSLLVSGSEDHSVIIWDLKLSRQCLRIEQCHSNHVKWVKFIKGNPEGGSSIDWLFTVGTDAKINQWKIKVSAGVENHASLSVALAKSFQLPFSLISCFSVSSGGDFLACTFTYPFSIHVYPSKNEETLQHSPSLAAESVVTHQRTYPWLLPGGNGTISGLCWMQNVLLSADGQVLKFWKLSLNRQNMECVNTINLYLLGTQSKLSLSFDRKYLSVSSMDTVQIWKFEKENHIFLQWSLSSEGIFNPDGVSVDRPNIELLSHSAKRLIIPGSDCEEKSSVKGVSLTDDCTSESQDESQDEDGDSEMSDDEYLAKSLNCLLLDLKQRTLHHSTCWNYFLTNQYTECIECYRQQKDHSNVDTDAYLCSLYCLGQVDVAFETVNTLIPSKDGAPHNVLYNARRAMILVEKYEVNHLPNENLTNAQTDLELYISNLSCCLRDDLIDPFFRAISLYCVEEYEQCLEQLEDSLIQLSTNGKDLSHSLVVVLYWLWKTLIKLGQDAPASEIHEAIKTRSRNFAYLRSLNVVPSDSNGNHRGEISSTSSFSDGRLSFCFAGFPRPVHTGVRCDGCSSSLIRRPIRGPRFHCTVCSDFDLCSSCEAKLVHPLDHPMIKFYLPKTATFSYGSS